MEKILTVVVPVFKVEQYINKCLDSLLISDELMKKIEVLVINDGTPDHSAVLAKEYEKRFPETFQVIDKENGGHGSAWNLGVKLAKGKYIRFLDSDDWLSNFESFVKQLENVDVDIVFTRTNIVNVRTKSEVVYDLGNIVPNQIYDADSFDWSLTNNIMKGHNLTNFHQSTYKASLLNPHLPIFLERQHYDDEILFVLPVILSHSFIYFDMYLYNYLVGREGQSIDPKVYKKSIKDKVKSRKHNQYFVNSHPCNSESKRQKINYILNKRNDNIYRAISKLSYKTAKKEMKDFCQFLKTSQPDFIHSRMYRIYHRSFVVYWILYHVIKPQWKIIKKSL